jgi:hypothetical protein
MRRSRVILRGWVAALVVMGTLALDTVAVRQPSANAAAAAPAPPHPSSDGASRAAHRKGPTDRARAATDRARAATHRAQATGRRLRQYTRQPVDQVLARGRHRIHRYLWKHFPRLYKLYRLARHPKRTLADSAAVETYGHRRFEQWRAEGFRFMRPGTALRKILEADGHVTLIITTDRQGREVVYAFSNEHGRLLAAPVTVRRTVRDGVADFDLDLHEDMIVEVTRHFVLPGDRLVVGFQGEAWPAGG